MTTRNAPATPLPWKDLSPATEMMRAHKRETNLAYAVHAVNSYPKLVAELRRLCVEIPKQLGSDQPMTNALLRELGEESQ
jgi:hypothetical protein